MRKNNTKKVQKKKKKAKNLPDKNDHVENNVRHRF